MITKQYSLAFGLYPVLFNLIELQMNIRPQNDLQSLIFESRCSWEKGGNVKHEIKMVESHMLCVHYCPLFLKLCALYLYGPYV